MLLPEAERGRRIRAISCYLGGLIRLQYSEIVESRDVNYCYNDVVEMLNVYIAESEYWRVASGPV